MEMCSKEQTVAIVVLCGYMDEQRIILLDSKESLCKTKRILQDNVPRRNDKQESNG